MPRRNSKVRQRNVPRAAQRQPRTPRTQFGARDDRPSSRQPAKPDREDRAILVVYSPNAQLTEPEHFPTM